MYEKQESKKKTTNNSEIGKCKDDQLHNFSPDRKSYEEPDFADNVISHGAGKNNVNL